jgi:hypothetical protein
MRATLRVGCDDGLPGVACVLADGCLALPRSVEHAGEDAGPPVAIALPHHPQAPGGIDCGPRRDIRSTAGNCLQLAPLGCLPTGDGDLPGIAVMYGYGQVELTIGAGGERRAEVLSLGNCPPLGAIGARDKQLFLLALITDPGRPGIGNIVESDSRIVVFAAVARGQIEGGGQALYFHAAVQKFQRICQTGVRGPEMELALRAVDAHLLRRFHRDVQSVLNQWRFRDGVVLGNRMQRPEPPVFRIEHSPQTSRAGPRVRLRSEMVILVEMPRGQGNHAPAGSLHRSAPVGRRFIRDAKS